VDFCQILLNNASAGCPVCVDSYGNINESVTLTTRRICGNNGEAVMPKKLMNIDFDIGKNPSKSAVFFSREYIGKFTTNSKNNKALANKFFVANNKRIPLFLSDTAPYMLCVVQDKGCATNLQASVLSDFMNKLHFSLNSEEKIRQNIVIPRIGYSNSLLISDEKPQISDLADCIISVPDTDSNGNVFMQIYYKTPLLCHWRIQLDSDPSPESYFIEKCFNNILCGSTKINMIPRSLVFTNISNIDIKKTYKVFVLCYNDLPYPVFASDVIFLTVIKNLGDVVKYDDYVPFANNNTDANTTISSGSAANPNLNSTSSNATSSSNKTRINY